VSISVLLAIVFPVVSVLLFKEFDKRNIEALSAIIFNYLGAIIIGLVLFVTPVQLLEIPSQSWFYSCLVVGFLFILNFYLIAKTAICHGVSIATFANKISLVFPVIFTIIYFNEPSNWIKITGISLAIFSIYLLTFKGASATKSKGYLFPLFIFVATGVLETIINYTQKTYFETGNEIGYFVISAFLVSFIFGLVLLMFKLKSITFKSILAGLLLSIPNTLGLYYFIKSLNENADSTSVLPVMNICTLILAILLGIIFYKEKLTKSNWIGFSLAILSIILLTLI